MTKNNPTTAATMNYPVGNAASGAGFRMHATEHRPASTLSHCPAVSREPAAQLPLQEGLLPIRVPSGEAIPATTAPRPYGQILTDIPVHGNGAVREPCPGSGRLKAWSWWERDPVTLIELAFVIATPRRVAVEQIRRRLALPGDAPLSRLGSAHSGYASAMRQPCRLLWMTLDHYAARSHKWLTEDQLVALRLIAPASRRRR